MGKIEIITNFSSKGYVVDPYIRINDKTIKANGDQVVFETKPGEYRVSMGYVYRNLPPKREVENYNGLISVDDETQYYRYKVPSLIEGKGKLKKISYVKYKFFVSIRKLINSWFFVIIAIIIIVALIVYF